MYILGISSFYHDSAAALIKDGNILFAAEEERFTRKKHDKSFPKNAISFCIKEAKISINEISQIVFYDRPFIKFERIMETAVFTAPLGYTQFHEMSKEWLSGGKLNLEDTINKELKNLFPDFSKKNSIHFCDHHLSHAASAYYPSPFKKAVILCLDGVGEWSTTTIWSAEENIIKPLALINFPHSLGLLYSAFTYFLGFKINDGEYKLMGLAPYGKAIYTDLILQNLIDVKDDGSFRLNLDYFNFTKGLTMTNEKFHQLFKIEPRNSEDQILEIHKDIARSIQEVTEIIILKMCRSLRHTYQYENLCLAGGVALNCVANGKIVEEKIFENIWVQPAAGDSGGAIGSALKYFHLDLNKPLLRGETFYDNMQGAYLGPQFSDLEIKESLDKLKANYVQLNEVEVISQTAELISQKKVIGWFQGRMEFGPRSLGSRSILADPRDKNMQSLLNLKIKFRESFRPFAPAVLYQDLKKYFDLDMISPYMLFVCKTKSDIDMPSITHVDQSARVQTVHQDSNSKFFNLISAFKEKTQSSVLINTSFNIRGEPIVCSPTDAYRCFMKTNMDVLVIGNFLLLKENQIKNDLLNYTTEELDGELDLGNQTEVRKKDILIFSLILALAAVFISYRYFFNNPNAMKFFILFISFLIVTPFVNYKLLITPYRKWMLLGKKMGEYKFRLFTFILYFLVLSPYGLFIRFFVNSPLKLKIDTNKTSYFQNEFDTNQAKP